ncbi:hypothetical protein [Pseudomonas tohonis]|uniref:DUF7210 family protein n=1 Tax=Pseudomonas tohonis TaxID=2725477 RepID=UPI0022F139AA|nr:hypothetical protein [Pseudomonas tohonis]
MKNDKTASVAEQPKPTVKVVITKENGHRHAGTKHPKGAVIDVSEADAKYIVDVKAGEFAKEDK